MSSEGPVTNGNNVSNGTNISDDKGVTVLEDAQPKSTQKKETKRVTRRTGGNDQKTDKNVESDPTPPPSNDTQDRQENEENTSKDDDQSDNDTDTSVGDDGEKNSKTVDLDFPHVAAGNPNVAPGPSIAHAARGNSAAPGSNLATGPNLKLGPNLATGPNLKPGPNVATHRGPNLKPGPNLATGPNLKPGPNLATGSDVKPGPNLATGLNLKPGHIVTHESNVDRREEQSPSNMLLYTAILFIGIFSAGLVAMLIPPEPVKPDFDYVKVFDYGMDKLQSSFTSQSDRFWKILKNRGLAHLKRKSPSQPLVILLAAPPSAHDTVDCLATKLAGFLDPKHKKALAKIDGENEKNRPGDETKKKMDHLLIEKFGEGHRAAVVHHLELLPPPSPLLFYSYCDNENAPHKHVAILFTVHLPFEPDSSLLPKEAEGTVEKYLSDTVWSAYDQDAVGALLSRITDTVVLMNGESRVLLKSECP